MNFLSRAVFGPTGICIPASARRCLDVTMQPGGEVIHMTIGDANA